MQAQRGLNRLDHRIGRGVGHFVAQAEMDMRALAGMQLAAQHILRRTV